MSQLPIYTIGYGAREIKDFIGVLQTFQIAYLIDVRSKPYSRYKPDFSKHALAQHLKKSGIQYVFMGNTLGGQPENLDCYTDGKVDYEKVRHMPFYLEGIGRLQNAHQQGLAIVVMCSEGKPEMCHRSKLIGESLTAVHIPLTHIDENNQPISQEDVILRLTKGQPSLFDNFFQYKSRKRYVDEDE